MTDHSSLAPFSLQYSPNFAELLTKLECSIAISTYQAGKVIFISPVDDETLVQLPRSFDKAMGIGIHGEKMVVACKDEVVVLKNSTELAAFYPQKPNTYDAMYMPRLTYHTGAIDIHDIDFCLDGIFAVNTQFSCVIQIDEHFSFTPVWKPNFVSKITAGDRCHLNGMAVDEGKIHFVTAFAQTDESKAWKATMANSGVVISYETGEVVIDGLSMPHSPRLYKKTLYVLQSGRGELMAIDTNTFEPKVVCKLNGFVRGLEIYNGFAFIGLSKIRKNSSLFGSLPIADVAKHAGVTVVHLETGAVVANLKYNTSVDEIYDVKILKGLRRPSLLNTHTDTYKHGLSLPSTTFWAKPK